MQKFIDEVTALGYDLKMSQKQSILTELQELGVKEADLENPEVDFLEFLRSLPKSRRDDVKEILKEDAEKTRAFVADFEARLRQAGNFRVRTKFFVAPYNEGIYLQVRILNLKR